MKPWHIILISLSRLAIIGGAAYLGQQRAGRDWPKSRCGQARSWPPGPPWPGPNVDVNIQRHLATGVAGDQLLQETIVITSNDGAEFERVLRQEAGLAELPGLMSSVSTVGTPFGFGFGAEQTSVIARSDQRLTRPIYQAEGRLWGYFELSNGPAYGAQVLGNIEIDNEIGNEIGNEPAIIRGNKEQVRQALDNLWENALKFTPEGGGYG
jgi:hypothetical protein